MTYLRDDAGTDLIFVGPTIPQVKDTSDEAIQHLSPSSEFVHLSKQLSNTGSELEV
jgi:hypothetical protein